MIRRMSVIGAAVVTLACVQTAIAGPAESYVMKQVPVPYGDLDLATPDGQAALHARIDVAARQACGGAPAFQSDYRAAPRYIRAAFERCVREAQDGAVVALHTRGVHVARR